MKIVIVDDERLARVELTTLLKAFPDAEVVGEAADVADAVRVVREKKPELVFLDIEMPEASGFELIGQLRAPVPEVIFVTAYDAYALRAFEVNALDYLMKPVVPERLAEAYRRAVEMKAGREKSVGAESKAGAGKGPLREDDQVFLRDDERCWFVPVRKLRLLEGEDNHTRVFFDGEKPMLYRTLVSMEERLPETLFFRANRSQLVNRLFVQKVEPWFSGTLKATLTDGTEVEFSRRQAQVFRERTSL
jgi:two-component system LytT family response regulator